MCVLALQVERWMRKKLAVISVSSAIRQLRRIKVVEITVGNTRRALPTRLTTEQKEILRKLGVPAPEKMAGNVL